MLLQESCRESELPPGRGKVTPAEIRAAKQGTRPRNPAVPAAQAAQSESPGLQAGEDVNEGATRDAWRVGSSNVPPDALGLPARSWKPGPLPVRGRRPGARARGRSHEETGTPARSSVGQLSRAPAFPRVSLLASATPQRPPVGEQRVLGEPGTVAWFDARSPPCPTTSTLAHVRAL